MSAPSHPRAVQSRLGALLGAVPAPGMSFSSVPAQSSLGLCQSLEVLAVMPWLTGQGKGLQTWILAAPGMTQRELSGQCRALQSPVIFKDDP